MAEALRRTDGVLDDPASTQRPYVDRVVELLGGRVRVGGSGRSP